MFETKEYSIMLVDTDEEETLVDIIVGEGTVDYDGNIEPLIMVDYNDKIWLLHKKFLDNVFVYKEAPKNDQKS